MHDRAVTIKQAAALVASPVMKCQQADSSGVSRVTDSRLEGRACSVQQVISETGHQKTAHHDRSGTNPPASLATTPRTTTPRATS